LAVSHFEAGDVSRAASLMKELGSDDMGRWIPVERFFNWENLAQIELSLDRIDSAAAIATRAEAAAAEMELRLPTVLAMRTRAAVLMAQGDPAAAAEAAAESISAAEAIGAGAQTAYSRSLRGQALAAAGERSQAIEVLRQAEQELDTCASVRMRDAARRELRKLGARAEKRGPASAEESGYAALTKREREIADLVTDRLTNRQIAETLFLSAKTVESHIRNLFMKLGASSRVEVARIVERERREST
jgi:DNA-binding NarL/FixJ family response regulator